MRFWIVHIDVGDVYRLYIWRRKSHFIPTKKRQQQQQKKSTTKKKNNKKRTRPTWNRHFARKNAQCGHEPLQRDKVVPAITSIDTFKKANANAVMGMNVPCNHIDWYIQEGKCKCSDSQSHRLVHSRRQMQWLACWHTINSKIEW